MSERKPVAPVDALDRLRRQLRILVPVLAAYPDRPETAAMLDGLRTTAEAVAGQLLATHPSVLAAIATALDHARQGRSDETCSELLSAGRALDVPLK